MPNNIDRNANSASRQRRNWQRLTQGAVTNTITTSAPIIGGSTIGLAFDANSGLAVNGDALAIQFADPSIIGSAGGIAVQVAALSALSTIASGLKVLFDGSTITLNSAGQLQASTSGGGGSGIATSTSLSTTAPLAGGGFLSTGLVLSIPQASNAANGYLSSTDWTSFNNKSNPVIAGDGSILIGSSTGSTTIQVQLNGPTLIASSTGLQVSVQAGGGLAIPGGGIGPGLGLFLADTTLVVGLTGLKVGTLTSANLPSTIIFTHLAGSTTTPTLTVPAGGPAGTFPTSAITGTDTAGQILLNVGTGTVTTGVFATVTFNKKYSTAPYVVLTPSNGSTVALTSTASNVLTSTTVSTFALYTFGVGTVPQKQLGWFYHVIG